MSAPLDHDQFSGVHTCHADCPCQCGESPAPDFVSDQSGNPAPEHLALCLECMHWWNADGGHICPDDTTDDRSHPVALYTLESDGFVR